MNFQIFRNTKYFLILILVIGFALRVGASVAVDQVLSGAYGFRDYAENLIAGNGYFWEYTNNKDVLVQHLVTFRPPAYTLFYTAMWYGFGNHSLAFIILQSLIGSTVPIMIFFITEHLWEKRPAYFSAAIACVYPQFLTRPGNVSDDNLLLPFICLGIFYCIRSVKNDSLRERLIAAVFIGLSMLTRQTVILFIPLSAFYIWYQCRTRKILSAAVFTVTIAAIMIPWILFHYSKYETVSLSDATGRTLWVGNNALTYAGDKYPYESIDLTERKLMSTLPSEDVEYLKKLNAVEQDHYFMEKALEFITANPVDFLQSIYRKNLGLFSIFYNPFPQNSVDKFGGYRQVVYTFSYAPLLFLGLCGVFLTRKDWKRLSVFYLFILSFILITWIFWSHTRHAISYHFVWIIFSGYSINYFLSRFKKTGGQTLAPG